MSHPDLVTDPSGFRFVEDVAADDPFTALRYHFGMLLGVDDFETEQACHRGRLRLHQGWLHGPGVVWGLAVSLDEAQGEVRVERGLATDAAGRFLHLDGPACLNAGAWYDEHGDEVNVLDAVPEGADVAFDAHVEISWASCLTRPVPALSEPCEDAAVETAHSRVWETIDLRLVPGNAEAPPERYRRVRILLGLLAPGGESGDQEAADARATVLATAEADRVEAALQAFRAMANLDAAGLAPEQTTDRGETLTPAAPPAPVVLADVRGLALRRKADDDGWELVGGEVVLEPRRSHVASETAQELVVASLTGGARAAGGTSIAALKYSGSDVTLKLSGKLDERSVQTVAFAVSSLAASGWEDVAVDAATYDETGDPPTIRLKLADDPSRPWQLLARGTGPAPLVDTNLQPLGGGRDFVHLEGS